jgi:protein SCO1/2
MSRKLLVSLGVLAVFAVATAIFINASSGDAYAFAGGEIKPARAAAPIDLTDQNGQPFTLDQVDGKVALVYFGYTTCPDLCPTTLSDFTAIRAELGEQADQVEFVMVTVDPERDSSARLKEYLGFFDDSFIGLRGDDAQTQSVKESYGVVSNRVEYPESATGYLVDHTSLIYVIDQQGRFRLTYPYGTDPALIVADLQHLIG